MLKTVLWIAAACVAVLVALAVSRGLHLDRAPTKAPEPAPVIQAPAAPAAVEPEVAPLPPPPVLPPPTAEDQQIQDDAAATGMTTVEPEAAAGSPPT